MNIFNSNQAQIIDSLRMKDILGDVHDKRGKIARMIDRGELIQLRRGLYSTRGDVNPLCFAASIYGPSYISFEAALSYYGLIPEAVYEITSATIKRSKKFETSFGRYRFRAIPEAVYPIGIDRETVSGIPFLIASPTKALCDRIAREPRMRSMLDVRRWAELMRFEEDLELDIETVRECAEKYNRPSVRFLQRTIEKYGNIL
jgi:predicted transcriptional regulator of viral defense system